MPRSSNLTSWQPGQSGNPKGRPKKSECLADMLREVLNGTRLLDRDVPEGMTVAEVFIHSAVMHAIKGNAAYAKEIWERIDGKAALAEPTDGPLDLGEILDRAEQLAEQSCREHAAREDREVELDSHRD